MNKQNFFEITKTIHLIKKDRLIQQIVSQTEIRKTNKIELISRNTFLKYLKLLSQKV